ncbi:MAG: hypothetical protein KDB21_13285 [Acidimicrobiales bacterium]|nr:hypothetical protein [Acidimicrobiales bacterium]
MRGLVAKAMLVVISVWAALAVVALAGCAEVPPTTVAAPSTPTPVPPPTPTPTPQVAVPGGTGAQLLVTTGGGVLLAGTDGFFQQVVDSGSGVRAAIDDGAGGLVLDVPGSGIVWLPAVGSAEVVAAGADLVLHDAGILLGQVHIAYTSVDPDDGATAAFLAPPDGPPVALGRPGAPVVAMSLGGDVVVVSRQELSAEVVTAWSEVWDGYASTIAVPGIPARTDGCRPAVIACPWFVTVSPDRVHLVVVADQRDEAGEPVVAEGGGRVAGVTVLPRDGSGPGAMVEVGTGQVTSTHVAADRLIVNVTFFVNGAFEPGTALVADLGTAVGELDAVPVAVPGFAWQPGATVDWDRPVPLSAPELAALFDR